jgi:hypothetical protein
MVGALSYWRFGGVQDELLDGIAAKDPDDAVRRSAGDALQSAGPSSAGLSFAELTGRKARESPGE